AAYFLILLLTIILFHVATPRSTAIISPRFFVPAFSVTSVMLGITAAGIMEAVRTSLSRTRIASATTALAIAVIAFYLWIPIWLEAPENDLDLCSGHKKTSLELVRALEAHNVQRIAPVQGIASV